MKAPRSSARPMPEKLSGKKVTVVGLGHFGGGVGLTRWLCRQGGRVTVSDKATAQQLADSIASLADLDVAFHLGGHDEADFLRADLLVVNPAVPKDLPLIAAAEKAGVPRTSEINLFLQRCPCRVIGVTGSVGKSTTTAMIGAALSGRFRTHVGGNIGGSLLESLEHIQGDDLAVLELSSFQLEDLPLIGISPRVALVTNLWPNHLDRHGTLAAYAEAKKNIFRFQEPDDVLILSAASEATAAWADEAPGRVEWFDPSAGPMPLSVLGTHNQANAQAALAVCREFGIGAQAAAALKDFPGLPHRLEFVVERDGIRYYNDSKCTTPEGGIVALEAFEPRRAIAIVGGYDKGAEFADLGAALGVRAKAVVAIGATAGKIIQAIADHPGAELPVQQAGTLDQAIAMAESLAEEGDAIILSPACASYDMFTNYEQRGERFVKCVMCERHCGPDLDP